MDAAHREVLRQRLSTQLLLSERAARAVEVVARLTCVQSQEPAHGFWSLGMRMTAATMTQVRRDFDAGAFVRTHLLRPTWHFVAAADLRWILAATSPRVQQRNAGMYRQLGLDAAALGGSTEVLVGSLAGGRHLTRPELGQRLGAAGFADAGQRLGYLIMYAELEGLICSGPMRGAQHTYALVEERVPPVAGPDDPVAELLRRFFLGHGPASLADFTRWSSLPVRDARAALARIAAGLAAVEIDGVELWSGPGAAAPDPAERALLLPLYDEVALSYPQLTFEVAAGHPHLPGADLFVGSVIVGTRNVGLWRRTVSGRKVTVETTLAPGLSLAEHEAIDAQRQRLADFLGLTLVETRAS